MENKEITIETGTPAVYSAQINNSSPGFPTVEEYFQDISEESVKLWENILFRDRACHNNFIVDDADILNEQLNMQNQRVIKNDCDRTRVKDKPLLQSFREYLECLLTYYCKKSNIKYKQGMNEIVGPFILIKAKVSITLSRIYNLFSAFIEKFLTNYYHEDEFFSLQSCMGLLNLLLKYHDPLMFNIFEFSIITPEMYATSWILTIFANKSKLNVLYRLWDLLIKENDQLFMHFFVVAFLEFHKEAIVTTDHSQIPSVLSQLNLKTTEEVDQIFKMAKEIRSKTPFSLRLMARKLEIFNPNSQRLKDLFTQFEPENMLALPLLPSEVFHIAYNNIVTCPDYLCKNFKNLYDDEKIGFFSDKEGGETEYIGKYPCYYCDNKKGYLTKSASSQISYILLDLRISEEKNNDKHYDVKPGFLPMTVILDQSELHNENFAENLSDRFLKEKDKYHFILITSETDYFTEYEEKFYKENISEREKRRMMYGLQTRVSKEINSKLVKQWIKKDKSKRASIRIKEFDNVRKLVYNFMKKDYPYVSYVHGGFREIHEQSMKYNIPLLNHDDNCYICKKKRKKNQKFGFFSKLFNNSSNNSNKHYKKPSEDLTNQHINNNNIRKISEPEKKEASKSFEQKDQSLMKSNLNNDLAGGKIIENLNKIENDSSNLLTIDDISNLISDPNYIVFTCLLIEYKHLYTRLEKNPPQIMMFLNTKEIKVYKLERSASKVLKENESLSFMLIETIKIPEIITIITRKQTKNIVTIQFTSDLFGKTSIIIDLITDIDSKSFIGKTKQYIEAFEKNK